jgi:hypothetical protein
VTAHWTIPGQRWRLLAPREAVALDVASGLLIVVDRQYVALPSLRRAIVVVEDTTDALRWACRSLVAPPPGVTWAHAVTDTAVRFLRRRPGAAGSLAAGRVVVGRTP